ncbi:hypothetical protein Cgig2_014882 [Carnegiea gigantea]|uniref:Uncharacterized protein n=1 Tax=Carnegiea gigantea TaxID=171969 RepID=A0A9Q1GWD8_9CARY|nr:hypothetical protein Cgig2_014882 [Carnegiea gigantea]
MWINYSLQVCMIRSPISKHEFPFLESEEDVKFILSRFDLRKLIREPLIPAFRPLSPRYLSLYPYFVKTRTLISGIIYQPLDFNTNLDVIFIIGISPIDIVQESELDPAPSSSHTRSNLKDELGSHYINASFHDELKKIGGFEALDKPPSIHRLKYKFVYVKKVKGDSTILIWNKGGSKKTWNRSCTTLREKEMANINYFQIHPSLIQKDRKGSRQVASSVGAIQLSLAEVIDVVVKMNGKLTNEERRHLDDARWAQVAEIEDNDAYAKRKKEARMEISQSCSNAIVIAHPSSPGFLPKDPLEEDVEVTQVGDKSMKDVDDDLCPNLPWSIHAKSSLFPAT